jgi:hypothetical protein
LYYPDKALSLLQAYCEKRLDAILGFADAYSLATVSKISAGFGDGVPVLTTTGLTTLIGYKKSYPYVTRMRGTHCGHPLLNSQKFWHIQVYRRHVIKTHEKGFKEVMKKRHLPPTYRHHFNFPKLLGKLLY